VSALSPTPRGVAPSLAAGDLAVRLGRRQVFAGVTFSVRPGERLAIVGPNGSGKTTLLRACAGIVAPEHGTLELGGRPLRALTRREIARRLGFMPQEVDLRFPMSGLEAVLLGRSPHKRGLGLANPGDLESARAAMARLEIDHLQERPVTSMSGGERQRLMLARVLVQGADVLLLDEPTSAQDPYGVVLVRAVLEEQAQAGSSVVAAVHDLNLALRAFDAVLVLADGAATAVGRPKDVIAGGALERAYGVALRTVPDGEGVWVVAERA
jgi:iron complex transport system ATP-binding protein